MRTAFLKVVLRRVYWIFYGGVLVIFLFASTTWFADFTRRFGFDFFYARLSQADAFGRGHAGHVCPTWFARAVGLGHGRTGNFWRIALDPRIICARRRFAAGY